MWSHVCVIVYTSQCNMTSRKRKTIGLRTEEELADVVNEIVNDSDSDTEGCYTQYHMLKYYWRYVLNFKSLSHIVFV